MDLLRYGKAPIDRWGRAMALQGGALRCGAMRGVAVRSIDPGLIGVAQTIRLLTRSAFQQNDQNAVAKCQDLRSVQPLR